MLPCANDAKEGRYVVVTDIPGAFLHTDMEDEVHISDRKNPLFLGAGLGLWVLSNKPSKKL